MRYPKKTEAYRETTKNPAAEAKNEYRKLKKSAKKAVAGAMTEEAVRKINELGKILICFTTCQKNEGRKYRCCWRKVHVRK